MGKLANFTGKHYGKDREKSGHSKLNILNNNKISMILNYYQDSPRSGILRPVTIIYQQPKT